MLLKCITEVTLIIFASDKNLYKLARRLLRQLSNLWSKLGWPLFSSQNYFIIDLWS